MLLFRVGDRQYACALTSVREIVPLATVARLPGAPAHVLGVMNVRGAMVTTVDLGLRLAAHAADRAEGAVLLLEAQGKVLGALVDAVQDVLTLEQGAEEAPPSTAGGDAAAALVRGLVQTSGGVAAILDPGALVRETLVTAGGDS